MTKMELIHITQKMTGCSSERAATEIVEHLLCVVKDTLASGEKVQIQSFGCFDVRETRPRMGNNVQTHLPQAIPARRVVRFKPAQELRQVLKGKTKYRSRRRRVAR